MKNQSRSVFVFIIIIIFGFAFIANRETKKTRQTEFIDALAQAIPEETAVLPSVIMAQAILESQWGQSSLSQEAHNYFGIKISDDSQDHVLVPTFEYIDGEKVFVDDAFRSYDSMEASILSYLELMELDRYQGVREATHYSDAANALYEGGYATDPHYPEKLINIIENYRLYIYDAR